MINITVCYATPHKKCDILLKVENHCTVESAIHLSQIMAQFPEINLTITTVGVFGRVVKLDSALHDGDRVEIYRPLVVDPKAARRSRAQ